MSTNRANPSIVRRMYVWTKRGIDCLHRMIAHAPFAARIYIELVGSICRGLVPQRYAPYVRSAVARHGIGWPDIALRPRSIVVTGETFRIVPHLGEFDEEALFSRDLGYEHEVSFWLSANAGGFDSVIEIGANVGFHSLLIGRCLAARANSALYCFEPSPRAAERLRINLALNPPSPIRVIEAAVSVEGGLVPFHCPRGHLTNGSLDSVFAHHFDPSPETVIVPAVSTASLTQLLVGSCLVKLDVGGYEPILLEALAELLIERKATVLVEVLDGTDRWLQSSRFSVSHRFLHLTKDGAIPRDTVVANNVFRDWLLVPRDFHSRISA